MSVTEEKIEELNNRFSEFINKKENVESITTEFYEDLLDEVLMGFVFDVHRTIKSGSSNVEEGIPDDESYVIIDSPGLDVFGQHPVKKSQECNCPNCDRGVAACRFATHLEKCMGMGRNSSRIASRRIANNTKDLSNFSGIISDDEDDVDWSMTNDKRKRKKERNGIKKYKQQKSGQRNGDSNDVVYTSNENSPSNYENMTIEEKKQLLTQICGVISEHTKKLCTRSVRCPQHTDEQRREMRANLDNSGQQDSINVDVVETNDDESQHSRENFTRWDQEGSSHSSPADSTSTTTSTNSTKKKETKSRGKGKNSKRDRNSPFSQGD
ncbi:ataxin-7-like protein 3 [Leptopilina heterotoma]|uniref:ataxin-7-like protein 3 n=1 Tax=Leptopilina heterotoma TaxID=63436 RepID=UPI001CA9DBC8|nr:ataxin-7-like protein 3 [Leptopilina heterotoma]